MSGGRAAKQKGNRVERECVNLAKGFGFESRRAWGSDGRSLGWHEEVDMVIDLPKSIGDLYKPCDDVYGQIIKEDRGEPLVTIRYKDFLLLLKKITG